MNDAVAVAIITGGISLLGSVIALVAQNRLTVYRLDQLEEKMDRHNSLVERMAVAENSLKVEHRRIDELVRKEGHYEG